MQADTKYPPRDGEVVVTPANDGARVALLGDWDLSCAPRLREHLGTIDATKHVVFDVSEMTYLDSSTMRVLVEFKKRSHSQHGTTAMYYGENEHARRLMSVSGVGALF